MTEDVVISVRSVRYKYPTSKDWVLKGIDLDIHLGEFLGIVGTTGAGKTTLCQCFNGLIPHYTLGKFEGTVKVENQDTKDLDVAALSSIVGLVFQDPEAQLVMSTVLEEVMLGLNMRGVPTREAKAKAMESLRAFGIDHFADRPPLALSGGQKQRVAIAAVMAMRPDILVLDEATSELDSLTVHRIFDICEQLNQQGTTIVLVSHEMELLSLYANRLILVDDGQVLIEGPPRDIFQQAKTFEKVGVRLPQVTEFALSMRDDLALSRLPISVEESVDGIRTIAGEKS